MSENTATRMHPHKRSAASEASQQSHGSLFEGNRPASERWFRGMLDLSQEVLQFTQGRLQEDVAAWGQLAGMRNFEEILQFQQHFAERMTKEYLEEFNRLSHIIAAMANGSTAPPRHSEPHADAAGKAAV